MEINRLGLCIKKKIKKIRCNIAVGIFFQVSFRFHFIQALRALSTCLEVMVYEMGYIN